MSTAAYRIDGRLVEDEAFYAAACDPQRSVAVEACAGAGKTWMLVSRIVRALLAGSEPHEILAITFTRKAAGEMRERLAMWLRQFALQGEAERVQELRARGLSEAQAHLQADALQSLHQRVLVGGRAVEVRTFHAWFSQLLRAAPLDLLAEIGLQPDMELIEDLEDLRPELFRRFHAAVLDSPTLRCDYQALVAARGRNNVLSWLDAAWAKRVEVELADQAGTLDGSVEPAGAVFPQFAALAHPLQAALRLGDEARDLARWLAASGKVRAIEAAQGIEAALAAADQRLVFGGLWAALFNAKGEPRKLGDTPAQHRLCDALRHIREAVAQQDAHEQHRQMAGLARCLVAEFAALKRRRGLVDMADLERVALSLLADSTLAGWVQERLDARVRHLLIDEFQDTSPLQWHALHAWLAGYAGAGGGRGAPSVFIVGDPKQSIYRFRRAEPRVFQAARHFVVEGLGGSVLECDHTRRNAPAVLGAVNAVFGALHREGLYPGWREHSTGRGDETGQVRALPAVERRARQRTEPAAMVWRPSLQVPRREPEQVLREAEAARVAAAVQELVRNEGFAPGEIFVLSRKRVSLRLVASALQALQLPFAAPEEAVLMASAEVRDLVAVLDVLASPGHDLALAHALKSPLFGASDQDLLRLADGARSAGGWWGALTAGVEEGSPALRRARALLQRWSAAAPGLPPHDLLDRIVHEGELMPRLAAAVPAERRADALAAVEALLAQALQLDGGRYATPYSFVRALRSRALKHPPPAHPRAVQLLTIHGAKGLEARVVFLMDTDAEPRSAEHSSLLVDWPVTSGAPTRLAFVASEARCPPSLQPLLEAENAEREREELNGLYVAMTRARERLVVSHTPPFRGSDSASWRARLESLADPWPVQSAGAIPVIGTEEIVLAGLPARSSAPLSAPSAQALRCASVEARTETGDDAAALLGQAVHRMLEWAAGGARVDRAQLARAAAAEFRLPPGRSGEVERLAAAVLDSPQAARFFDPAALRWAGNEVPVSEAGQVLRIDRLVQLRDSGAWWVLDYKLRSDPATVGAYREQLARYRRAVMALQPGDAVHAAFLAASGAVVELA